MGAAGALLLAAVIGCSGMGRLGRVDAVTAPAPSADEHYCAWYGDERDGVLYFGESPFWSAARRAGGQPSAEMRLAGPQQVGRFDLRREAMLAPLPTGAAAPRAGTWDVLAHPNGRIYFTTFFEAAGWIDPATGAAARFEAAGSGLNELALLPDGRLLATRYAADGRSGSLVVLDADGAVQAERPLEAEVGTIVAPKSLAYDPVRRLVWLNTDLLPRGAGAVGHDARILDLATGREQARIASPELQFPLFTPDGRGHLAWLEGSALVLRTTEPGEALDASSGRALVLDAAFPGAADFVQDVRAGSDGRVVVTRWSGVVHVVAPSGAVRTVHLPRRAPGGLYYTAVAVGGRVCATYCADVTVVCAPIP